jgi:hypothetical protein
VCAFESFSFPSSRFAALSNTRRIHSTASLLLKSKNKQGILIRLLALLADFSIFHNDSSELEQSFQEFWLIVGGNQLKCLELHREKKFLQNNSLFRRFSFSTTTESQG